MAFIPAPPRASWKTWKRFKRRMGVIGHERRGCPCYEYTYYYTYTNPERPYGDREFEFRIRVPVPPIISAKNAERAVTKIAHEKMRELLMEQGKDVVSNFEHRITGIRGVGRTRSRVGKYKVLAKHSKWAKPVGLGWGTIPWEEGMKYEVTKELVRRIIKALGR